MNEVEKMYENAGIKPLYKRRIQCKDGYKIGYPCDKGIACINCNRSVFENVIPPFTAEKQLELIKWLSTKELKIRTNKQPYAVYVGVLGNDNTCFFGCEGLYFEQTLAEVINNLWQDLTEEERKQVKGILE